MSRVSAMTEAMEFLATAALVGAGATAFMDLVAIARQRLGGVVPADYALVGRWLGHMARGRFRHDSISAADRIGGERLIGWTAHYAIGMSFAALLLAIWGLEWTRAPTLGPALIVGIGSVIAPFLLMQPGMGAGIAASRTPHPNTARFRSLLTHTIFGLGLYLGGWMTRWLEI